MEVQEYTITDKTLAIGPANHPVYQSVIYEMWENEPFYSREKPIDIIKSGCLEGFSDYEGRKKAYQHYTHKRNRPAILICVFDVIVAVPIISPEHFENWWIFSAHTDIRSLTEKRVRRGASREVHTEIMFTDRKVVAVPFRKNTVQNQIEKGQELAYLCNKKRFMKLNNRSRKQHLVWDREGNYDI